MGLYGNQWDFLPLTLQVMENAGKSGPIHKSSSSGGGHACPTYKM
jgi:hypothetical protein